MEGSKRSSSNRCMPADLIIEILSRLPVRTLVRFCCVCKFWQSLITSNRCFSRSHLQKNSSNSDKTHDKNYGRGRKHVFINPVIRGPACNNVNLYSSRCIEDTDPQGKSFSREINCACRDSRSCRLIFERDNFKLAGCCDGIICFYVFGDGSGTNLMIYLYNPALNQTEGSFQKQ